MQLLKLSIIYKKILNKIPFFNFFIWIKKIINKKLIRH